MTHAEYVLMSRVIYRTPANREGWIVWLDGEKLGRVHGPEKRAKVLELIRRQP